MAPAHPHATSVAVYPALFFKQTDRRDNFIVQIHESKEEQVDMGVNLKTLEDRQT